MSKKENLIRMYTESGYRILELINTLEDTATRERQQQLLTQIFEIVSTLSEDAAEIVKDIIQEAYKRGSNDAAKELVQQGVKNSDEVVTVLSTVIHTEAVQEILDETFYRILEANDNMTDDVKQRITEITRKANQRSLIEGVSRRKATKDAIAEVNKTQINGIVAKNGAKIPVDKYMAKVIQYHQRKAHVDGVINRMIDNDQDLVYVNHVGITCEVCAVYQGRVYSLSGNDKRFPRLDRRPPYHGHCVHSVSVWNEAYHDASDIEEAMTSSNRPFADNRTEKHIQEYEKNQREKSFKNETRKQWIRYKARLPALPDLRVFASQKARNTKKYQEWMADYRKIGMEIKNKSP